MNLKIANRSTIGLCSLVLFTSPGCGTAPRWFSAIRTNPAAINRARAVGLGDSKANNEVIPSLIDRLEDSDSVVRMMAHEDLKRRTGQDFGYIPWADATERRPATEQWKNWWRLSSKANAKPGETLPSQ